MNHCFIHLKIETSMFCGKCSKPICLSCVGDDSIGIKCKECITVFKNPIYNIPIGHQIIAISICVAAIPVLVVFWISLTVLIVDLFGYSRGSYYITHLIYPVFMGWALTMAINAIIRQKRSNLLFGTVSLSLVLSLVGILIFDSTFLSIYTIAGIGCGILIAKYKLQ
ncbi:MAG TPA: hypothetical protein DEZ08_02180 [Dehalococcoidia bacterium]|jgi:hypothetical protein|nr:hypothetical protein [Dehalococcoidia bacterium]|tara:strand:- start:416 stop:916 length:501 start_codon:yes stop_codon:yes gene_type:complete